MFRWGAATNLGLLAREGRDITAATRYLSAAIPTPQAHGNFWLGRELLWRAPMSRPGPPLPMGPSQPNPVAGPGPSASPIAAK